MAEKITFNCSNCHELVEVDISSFEISLVITDHYYCSNNHKTELKIKGGKIIDKKTEIQSEIDKFPKVPDHLKILIKEAYVCQNAKTGKAGAMMVRLILDGLLFEMSYQERMVGEKVTHLSNDCATQPFKTNNDTLCRRIPIFRTISDLSGYHAHAQSNILDVVDSEFAQYLFTVEGAIKEKWA